MTVKKLTVCMPVYNGSKHLAESIASVLNQSYKDFHLIICDDCSTDDSAQIIRGFHDPRISYFLNPKRMGLVGNWNKCVSLSTGEYIYLWHQDDVMLPENLRKKVELLDAHPTVGFVHSNIEWVAEETGKTADHCAKDSRRDYVIPGYFFFLRNLMFNAVSCPTAMMRARCYTQLGSYREELPFTCDYEFFLRASLYYDVACIGEPLVRNRWHSASESQNFLGSGGFLKQFDLARKIVLAEHGHRIYDRDLAAEMVVDAAAWEAIHAAVNALSTPRDFSTHPAASSDDFRKARRYCYRAIRHRPSLLTRRELRWVFKSLLLGPVGLRIARRVKHWLIQKPSSSQPPLAGLPKQGQ